MRTPIRVWRQIMAALLLGVTLAACGGEAATTGPSAAPASQPAATATAASASPPTSPPAATAASASQPTSPPPAAAPPETSVAASKLNLNTATEDQLLSTIPGFGNRMVREFMEYRPYISIQQFRKEIGKYVDAAQIAQYEQYVYVPVEVDSADAATLQQLPGVDASIAEQLIAARPYGASAAFLSKLASLVSASDAAAAQAYLAGQ